MMKQLVLAAALAGSLAACAGTGGLQPQPADPKVTAEIGRACAGSGLFKLADGTLTMFVPAATLPVDVINAGVDQVCADPARFAADISTAEWVVKNTVAAIRKKKVA